MNLSKFRKAVFILVYSLDSNKKISYLLLKRKKHWIGWEFPKGKIERFESKRKTAIRELQEETGLNPIYLKKFNKEGKYLYPKELKDRPGIIGQTFHLFAAQTEKRKAKIDKKEHSGSKWVSYEEAIKLLTYENQKECLTIIDDWLQKN